jgi:hypothetical protein
MSAAGTQSRTDARRVKPRSDAYVGLLGLSLLALSLAMLFAFLNWQTISEKPKAVNMAPAGGGGARPASAPGIPANPQAGAPGVQPKDQVPPPGVQAPGNTPPPGIQPQKK